MKLFQLLAASALCASSASAVSNPHRRAPVKLEQRAWHPHPPNGTWPHGNGSSPYLTPKSKKFVVNGKKIPDVNFDIGESYAGTLPITANTSDPNQLYFWFFPSQNPAAKDEVVIWLNGGPGCSSLDGLLQENGPFLWQSGTYAPIQNPFSWTNLSNIVYVDQPIGTGFSPAAPGAPAKIKDEKDVARDFMGFWKNFMNTFDLQGRKVYITGESYAGQYIPYIAYYMLLTNDTKYFNVNGIQINDPSINSDDIMIEAPSVWHLNDYKNVFALNETFMTDVNARAQTCGWINWMETALTFPPLGPIPTPPNGSAPGCDVWGDIITAAILVNPCFNLYHLTDFCPFLWDVMGFPSLGWGPNNYFNRSDVQRAINAPPTNYAVCGDDTLGLDSSPPSGGPEGVLPQVIERTNNVIIGHGLLDYLLLANGSLATIQNMTWNGAQGFQSRPTADFFVPYNPGLAQVLYETENQPIPATSVGIVSGGGVSGVTHTERGLTFVTVNLAGHEIPQYVPSAAFRQLEFLLGRIESLEQRGSFTTQG